MNLSFSIILLPSYTWCLSCIIILVCNNFRLILTLLPRPCVPGGWHTRKKFFWKSRPHRLGRTTTSWKMCPHTPWLMGQTVSLLMGMYIHIYIHTYMHTFIHMHIYIYTYMHLYIHTYIHAYIHLDAYTYTYMPSYIYTYVHNENWMLNTHTYQQIYLLFKDASMWS